MVAVETPPVSGRIALLEPARSMKLIASATINSEHIEGSRNLACSYGTAVTQDRPSGRI
jgi:hypothetical protein